MQSMKLPYLSSLGARRTKHGFERRATWLMVSLAVLLAVLAVAVPVHRTAWANEPVVTISVTDINYETATASFTVTGLPDSVTPTNWIASVNYKAPPDRYGHTLRAGPGKYSETQDDFTAVLSGNTLTADNVHLTRLIPDGEHTLTVTIMQRVGRQSPERAKDSTTFTAEGGCSPSPEPNHKDPESISPTRASWFGIYEFRHVTETEFLLEVSLNASFEWKHAPVNSGACVYYKYDESFGTFQSGIITAYIHDNLSGGKRGAFIRHTGLTPATRYGFRLTMDEESDVGDITVYGTTLGPNTGIDEITFTDVTQNRARATATIENASMDPKFGYWHYRESPIDSEPEGWGSRSEKLTEGATFPIELDNLEAGTRYELEASVKDNFNPNMSMTKAFVTLPGKPGISPLEMGDGSLKVTWTVPTEGAATITGYRVQWQEYDEYFDYNTSPPPTSTLDYDAAAADITNHTIENLTNGTEYVVIVIAKNESFDDFGGTASDYESGTPMALPNAPNNLQVAPGNEKLTLTWEEPTAKAGVTVNGYKVQWKADTVTDWDAQTGVTEVSESGLTREITSLTNGTTYDVRVRADNGITSDNYNWAEDDGMPRPDPIVTGVTVSDATITRTTAIATVAIDNQTSESQTVHLRHRVNTSGSSWTDATPKDTSAATETFDLSSLTGNTEYLVEAWLAGTSSTKESATFTTKPVEPDAPRNVRITGHGDKELTVAWDAPSDTGGSQITGYKVQWKLSSQNDWNTSTEREDDDDQSPYKITEHLTNGDEYAVRIIAVTSAGDGSPSNEAKDTPRTIPDAPTISSVTEGDRKLTVIWSAPSEDGGADVTGYKVQWKADTVTDWDAQTGVTEVSESGLTREITGLTNGTTYDVRVRADNGETSDNYNWAVDDGTPKPEPIVTGVTVADSTITRTTATATVAIDNQTIDSQTVHLRHRVNTSGSSWTDATPKDTSGSSETFNLSSLEGNTEYVVEAWLAGTPNTKESATFTTKPVEPDAPRNVRITGHGDRELTVAWDAPSDTGGSQITGYKVQWKLSSQNDWNTSTEREDDDDQSPYKITEHLTNGDEYAVRIIAVTSAGDGSPSNEAKDTPRTIPDAPTISSVTEGDRKLTVIWSAPSEDGGADVTGYKVQWKDNSVTTDWDSPTGVTEVSASGLTREITSLTNDTTYGVRVRADNGETSDNYNWAVDDGTPKPDPSIDSISVADSTITQTTAVATVNIADPTGDALMVHLRYRVDSSSEAWTTPTPQSTTTNSVAFPQFTGLKSDTEYRVEASFDSTFNSGVQFKMFTTKRPTVLSVVVDDSTISQAGATATVTIQEPNGKQQTVRLRYRPSTQNDWSTTATDAGEILVNTSTDVAAVPISDLTSGTLYDVEASLESDYRQSAATIFTTEGPSLTGLTFSEVMQESAKATIGIQAPNGRSLPVFVRYRKVTDPVNEVWTRADTSGTDTTAMAPLSDLTSGTEYEVQASLEDTFLAADTVKETFTTHDPSLSGLTVMSVTLMGATLKVDILAPNGESQTINYRYRPVIQTDWTITATDAGDGSATSATESATFTLASLTSGTQYQIQVSLDTDLNNPTLPVLEATLTTLTPDPSISDVAIDAKQTTAKATITIANPGTSGNTVHLHFREQGTNAWSSPALTSTTSTSEAAIDMTSLTERTVYEVEVALNSGFTSSTTVTFTTLVTPTITSVSVDDITKTTATATVAIANPDGTDRTVHLQYRIKDATPADTWTKAMEDSDTGSQEFDLASLKPGTTYEVEASFDSNFVTGVEDTEFTTTYTPSISSVSVDSITKTTATATVSIANPDDTSRTIHLQYREKDATPADTWTKAMEDTDTGSQEFDLASLTPGTTYEVQASFDSSFSPHKDTTFTTVFEPSISAVGVGDIEKTTATATVVIANPDGTNKTVNLQYREYNQEPEAEWTKPTPKDTATGSETFDLTSLTPGTTYEVQASFDSNFDTYKDTTFTTKFAPTISAVRVDPDSITKTTASVIVIIANPDGTGQTVQLQYRIRDPQGNWSSTQTEDTTTGSATINLTGLTAGTTYDVEVSLASGFGSTQTATFTTKFEPSISAVSIGSVAQTTATAAISIDNADDSIQTVHLQYREKDATPPAAWMSATPETSTTSAASIDISGLTADKTYEVEAWLANDTAKKVTATFTTLKDLNGTPTPSVSSVGVSNITMKTATATVNIANPGNAQNTVNLRHSVDGEDSWTDHTKTETGSTVAIDLSSLTAGTTYEVEAWLSTDTSKKVTATFTTPPAPIISSISVGSITRTSASATVNIANPGTAQNTVNLRYSVDDEDSWTDHTKTETGSTVSFPLSGLTAGTTYKVEAWLGSDTDNKAAATFTTTLPAAVLSPTINSVRVGNILETTATATVSIANPDDTSRTVHLQYREKDANPPATWITDMEDSDTGSQEFDLTSLTPGTTYEVQASFDSSFSPHKDTTFTTVFEPSISGVSVGSIEKTTATATVVIANPDGTDKTVNLQYREYNRTPEAEWTSTTPKDTATGSTTFDLSSLTPGTTYEVQASFDTNFDTYKDTTFTTKFAPTISAVSVGSITKTTAVATVTIANPDGTTQTVQLQYRINDAPGNWSSTQTENTTTGSATINLTGLTAGTTYDVEVSLASGFGDTQVTTFTTKFEPSISAVSIGSVTQTTASAAISIDNADGSTQTVHLQYREKDATPPASWTSAQPVNSTTSAASIPISGLTADRTYEVEAWLANDITMKVTATFTTLKAPNGTPTPSVSSVGVSNITMKTATATVNIANPGTAQNTVNLRYSVKDKNDWTDKEQTETGSTIAIDLSSLTAGTTYEVEAWLSNDDTKKVTATFTTSPAPIISSISVGSITRTSASATVNIANPGTAQNTVNLRHSVDGENDWTDHTKTETGSTVAFPLSSLTAGTTYEVEAWLGSDTGNKATTTFTTTLPAAVLSPTINSVRVGNILETTATATVNIDNADGSTQTARLQYRTTNPQGNWSSTYENTSTTGTTIINFGGMTAGTRYQVQAWLASDSSDKVTASFQTQQAAPNNPPPQRSPVNPTPPVTESPEVASVSVTNETQTTADATVKIDNAGTAQNTVNLRYSVDGEDSWTDHTKTEAGSTVRFPLSSLTAGTAYEVEAWLGSDTDNKVTATFTTLEAPNGAPTPSVSSVSVGGITQTTATATVNIANPGDAQNTVNLRYSVEGEDSWTDHTKSETGSAVEFPLSGLTAGTTYEVEAWLGNDTDNKVTATFTTIQADAVTPPSISSVRVLNIAQTNARVVVGLANAAAEQRVYMQYKLSSAQWPTTLPQPTTQMNGSATFILSNLTAGTGYHTRVSLNSDMSDATTRSFTTSSPPPPQNPPPPRSPVVPPPSVSLVTFNNETQTSADATVNIADAGTAKKTVRLHHRIEGTTGWSTPPKVMKTPGSSTTILLTGLTAGTTYEVQAWLNSNAPPTGTTVYTFNTLPNDPDISNLKMKNIRQTSATAMVEIADAGTGMKEVYLKHSIDGTDEWSQLPFPTITYADSTSIELTGLEEQTTYQVMVDLTDGFDKAKSSTFTTLAAPSLSGVSISSITRTGAVATATIADAGTAQKTMHLRHREFGETEWSTAQTKTTTGANAAFNLTGLDPRTTYEVQASLDSEFGTAKYAVFTTLSPDPSVSDVSVDSITQTSATTTVTIVYPGIARKTVRLRYRVSGETEWGAVQTKVTRGGSAAIDLTGLSPRTTYEVEASLSSDFAGSKTATFSTLSLDPSVSGVSIGSITQTSAVGAVTIANPGTAQKTVHLQYRVDGASEWSDSALTATTDGPSATIYMTGLVANTEYEVRASLASDFALAQHATFTTLRYPSISDVDVTDVTKNTATAEIDIADPDGSSQTVHLRYRTTPQGTWSSTFTTASTTGEASIDLTGLTVDTEYEVEASLATDFAVAVSDIFRTQPPDPVVAEVSVNSILQTTATASIDIANANGSTLRKSACAIAPRRQEEIGATFRPLQALPTAPESTCPISHPAQSTMCRHLWRIRSRRRAPSTIHSRHCAGPALPHSKRKMSPGTAQPSARRLRTRAVWCRRYMCVTALQATSHGDPPSRWIRSMTSRA